MAKVFLSHSSKDKELINFLSKELGHSNVIVDNLNFESGKKSIDEIYSTMNSSDIFVLFISENSLNSEWVEKEIFYADGLIRNEKLSSFLPLVIDDTDYNNKKIPVWLRNEYSLRPIRNEIIILNKIKNAIREVNFRLNPVNVEIENTFFGQSELIDTEINKFYNVENWKPSCIIAYNHFEGIGRRTVIKNLLKRARLLKENYNPVEISLSKESIESFILKLNSNILDDKIIEADLSELSLEEKIDIASNLIEDYSNKQELIFIIDDGAIILPNTQIVEWFVKLISKAIFVNKLVICLVSKYRPNRVLLSKLNRTMDFKVEELNKNDRQSLFIKYLEILKIEEFKSEDKKYIINKLSGVPSQIIYSVNLIKELGVLETKNNIQGIIKFSDHSSSSLLEIISNDFLTKQILLILSENPEMFSWSLIHQIFDTHAEEEISASLQKLYDLSTISFLYGGYEYIKLSPTLADFVSRSKLYAENRYRDKLIYIIKSQVKNDLDDIYRLDQSQFFMTLQSMIENGHKINKKYFVPSYILKSIIKEYDKGNNPLVVKLCKELLENSNGKYDFNIVWELHYKLCQSLAKLKKQEFFDQILYFKDNELEYNFLMGFNFRHQGNKKQALKYYDEVLKINPTHKRTKHELVSIYLNIGDYKSALAIALENYEGNKSNIYNIHSLFVCIVRTGRGKENINILTELLDNIKKSPSSKSKDMIRCMQGEFEYYINNNLENAMKILNDATVLNENKVYPSIAIKLINKSNKKGSLVTSDTFEDISDIDYLSTND